jgi:hypothetical protein
VRVEPHVLCLPGLPLVCPRTHRVCCCKMEQIYLGESSGHLPIYDLETNVKEPINEPLNEIYNLIDIR